MPPVKKIDHATTVSNAYLILYDQVKRCYFNKTGTFQQNRTNSIWNQLKRMSAKNRTGLVRLTQLKVASLEQLEKDARKEPLQSCSAG